MSMPGLSVVGFLLASVASAGGGIVNPVSINNENATKTKTDGTATTASFTFNTNRSITNQDGTVLDAAWVSAGYTVGNYSVRVTVLSGTTPTGTMATWLNLGTARTWSLTDAAGAAGTKTCSLKVEIKEDATGTILDTATYTITADSQASGGATVYTPVQGSYSNSAAPTATYTVSASVSVAWTWSYTGNIPTSNIASGGSGAVITFSLTAGVNDKTSVITLTSGGKTWTLTLTAYGDGGGGQVTL